jgi:inner membrane protein
MDLFTQGILGAAASQAVFARRLPRSAWIIGCVAGMLADADVLIHPASDPLGGLTFHRHFTHSLAFIPIGALLAALPFFLVPAFRQRKTLVYLASLVAYATHALLDCCTSYGTMYLWPLSDMRIAWDLIAIIDPMYTVPLLIGVIITARSKRPLAVRVALCLTTLYMGFGIVQRDRALEVQQELAAMRGQTLVRGRVIPVPLSMVLWRSVYLTDKGELVADGVRVPYVGQATVRVGSSIPRLTIEDVRKAHPDDAAMLAGFERFAWFADGYTGLHELEPMVVGDMRYCAEPQTFDSLWGFTLDAVEDNGGGPPMRMVRFEVLGKERFTRIWSAMWGTDEAYQTLGALREKGR